MTDQMLATDETQITTGADQSTLVVGTAVSTEIIKPSKVKKQRPISKPNAASIPTPSEILKN